MSPITHFLAEWLVAAAPTLGNPSALSRREKTLIVAAAVIPDLDGLALIPELLPRHSSHPLLWFSQYHHALHNLTFALICTCSAFIVAGLLASFTFSPGRRLPSHPWLTALLVFISFHLHLVCDLIGSRGPDGYQWPISYLRPFSDIFQLTWHSQWALNGWQNVTFTALLLIATLWMTWRFETSPLELFAGSGNRALVQALRYRFQAKTD